MSITSPHCVEVKSGMDFLEWQHQISPGGRVFHRWSFRSSFVWKEIG